MKYERITFANPQELSLDSARGLGIVEASRQDYRAHRIVAVKLEVPENIKKAIELFKKDATIVQVYMPAGTCSASFMHFAGLDFLDRYVIACVNVAKSDFTLKKRRLAVRNGWEDRETILDIAAESFSHDSRFRWAADMGPRDIKNVLSEYLDASYASEDIVFRGYSKDDLVAFLILERIGEEAIIRLAAVDAMYRALGVAVELYYEALEYCRQADIRALSGRVSTSNTSAMNIYSLLDARFSQAEDVYITMAK